MTITTRRARLTIIPYKCFFCLALEVDSLSPFIKQINSMTNTVKSTIGAEEITPPINTKTGIKDKNFSPLFYGTL